MLNLSTIAFTAFIPTQLADHGISWMPEGFQEDGSALIEFAGRACYQSWSRPNPKTATNAGYIANILSQRHFSVLEHASHTFYVEGVSRALTHELVRHRHLSYSQLSQRFVDSKETAFVTPPAFEGDNGIKAALDVFRNVTLELYDALVVNLEIKGLKRKQAREAARAVLPNMTETKIVISGNLRAWRHFIAMRATLAADAEIRQFALAVLDEMQAYHPHVFADFRTERDERTGVMYATCEHREAE